LIALMASPVTGMAIMESRGLQSAPQLSLD
jgi:hypothetical protein